MKPIAITITFLAALLAACGSLQPTPELAWDPSPDAVLIEAVNCCGLVPGGFVESYIPDARLWGDGRIVWVTQQDEGGRQVWEGHLSEAEVRALLQDFAASGFFEWKEHYEPELIATDLPTKSLTVYLQGKTKRVSEYMSGAPPDFHRLYDWLASGAGAEGRPYRPQRGLLRVWPTADSPERDLPTWDAARLGVDLAQVGEEGQWIEGGALQLAWELSNENPWNPVVVQDGVAYGITLAVPGVTWREPGMH